MSLQHRSAGSWSLAALLALIAGLLVVPTAASRADAPVPAQDALLVNGPNARVTAITHDAGSGQSYVAGDFTRWGPQTGGMGMVNNTTGALNTGFPAVRGFVRAAVPDGAGASTSVARSPTSAQSRATTPPTSWPTERSTRTGIPIRSAIPTCGRAWST